MPSDVYGSAVLTPVLDPYLDGMVGSSVPALSPLDCDDSVASHKLFQPEVIDFPGLEAVQVNVVQRAPRTGVFLNQRKRRARHVVGLPAEAACEASDERGFASPELPVEKNDVAWCKRSGKPLPCRSRLLFTLTDEARSRRAGFTHDSRLTWRRAVSSRTASPRRAAMSPATSAVSPSSASARSPAVPWR